MSPQAANPIPVTIVTGFLGSGKTTLLNRILTESHGQRIAVIENEFGEVGIDNAILLQDREERIVETMNGCICCTVRGDLVRVLCDLTRKRDAGTLSFDRVVIETTGLADPSPVAQTFFLEDEVARAYRLDGIVTLVDAKHGARTLDEHGAAQKQVGFADRILISKTDLVPASEALSLTERLRHMNARAQVKPVQHGRADLNDVFELGGFDLSGALDVAAAGHAAHAHDDQIASFVYRHETPFDLAKLESFLGLLIERYGEDLLRYKGVLNVAERQERIVFQGVQSLVASEPGALWREDERRESTLVFIGRNLPRGLIERGLALCIEGSAEDPATVMRDPQ